MGMSGTIGPWNGNSVALPDFNSIYLNRFPTPSYVTVPEWILSMCGEWSAQVENTTVQLTITRNEVTSSHIINMELVSGEVVHLTITDELMQSLGFTMPRPALMELKLETFYSPWPVLGWRGWQVDIGDSDSDMVGYYGHTWHTPSLEASCVRDHDAPYASHNCGIYLLKQPYALDDWGTFDYIGLVVATNVIEHERGYRVGKARCIALSDTPQSPGWDGITVMTTKELGEYEQSLLADPDSIPAP